MVLNYPNLYIKSIIGLLILFYFPKVEAQMSHKIVLSIDSVIDVLSLETPDAQIEYLNYKNEILQYKNYQKEKLPSISFNITPFSLSRSLITLQKAENGEYYHVENYSNSSTANIFVQQIINATGGKLKLSSSLDYLNEISYKRHSYNTIPLVISYSQQLWGGGKLNRLKDNIEKNKNIKSLTEYYTKISEIQHNALNYYMAVVLASLEQEQALISKSSTDTLFEIASMKYSKNSITELNYKQIKLQSLNCNYSYENSIKNFTEKAQNLITYLNIPYSPNELSIIIPTFRLPIYINYEDVKYYVEKNNPEILKRKIAHIEAEQDLFSTKLNNSFNANISISYGMNQSATEIVEAYKHPSKQQSISIDISIPIFQWGINRNKIRIAQNTYRSSMIASTQEQKKFDDDIINKVNTYNHNVRLWLIAEKSYQLAKEQYTLTIHKYMMNKSSIYELTSAQQEQSDATQKYYKAMCDVWEYYFILQQISLYDFRKGQELTNTIHIKKK